MESLYRALSWDIQKQLHLLSEEQLHRVALSLEDERNIEVPAVTGTNELELVDFIVDYMRSDQLTSLEDQGMACLLLIKEKIDELKANEKNPPVMDIANSHKETGSGSSTTEQDKGAPGSSADKDRQQINNQNPGNRKRKSSSLTDPSSMDEDPKRPDDDSTGQREPDKTQSDVGATDGKEQSIKNCPATPPEDDGASGSSSDEVFFGAVTTPSRGVHEMKIGSIIFQVKTGDITKEKTDVIVNSSNRDFTLYSGVSKAILDAAGPSVVSSAVALGSQPHNGYVITGPGNLKRCKWILHVIGPKFRMIVLDILQECEKYQAFSVTFPAVGTGIGGLSASTVADSILNGLVYFIKSTSVRSLQTVKVVLFQQYMMNDFYMSMKKRERFSVPEAQSSHWLSGGDSLTLPSHWKPMAKSRLMEVDVPPGTPEYSTVQQQFQRSCRNKIVKILRVQNRDLWLQYQIKKQNIDSKNRSTNNEKELFHGTDFNSIIHINHNGFNRSYAGRNAAAFGNGTYFAVNADYSADDTFSKPDRHGHRHMYLVRVLTGRYCVGQEGMKAPPGKNDSVTDNVKNPEMFVIFNDIQAYPEYHIIFQ